VSAFQMAYPSRRSAQHWSIRAADGGGGSRMTPDRWCVSPDGRYLAEVDESQRAPDVDHVVRVRELMSGKVVMQAPGCFSHLQFLPDGKRLACLCREQKKSKARPNDPAIVRTWDIATGNEVRKMDLPKKSMGGLPLEPCMLLFSSDGKHMVVLSANEKSQTASLWSSNGKRGPWPLEETDELFSAVAFSPDGQRLAGVSRGKLRLWDVATGKLVGAAAEHPEACFLVSFSPDGKLVATNSNSLRVWNLVTGKKVVEATKSRDFLFAPDSRMIAVLGNGVWIDLFDTSTGEKVHELRGPWKSLLSLVFWPEIGHGGPMAFSPDGSTLTAGHFGTLRRWHVATGRQLPPEGDSDGLPVALTFSPDSSLLAATGPAGVTLWDTTHKQTTRFLPFEEKEVPSNRGDYSIACSPDGRFVAAGAENDSIVVLHAKSGRRFWQAAPERGPLSLAFTDRTTLVSAGMAGQCAWWDATSGRILYKIGASSAAEGNVSVALIPGAHMSASHDGVSQIQLRELATGKLRRTIDAPRSSHKLILSPDGKFLLRQEGGMLGLLDTASGKELRYFAAPGSITDATFSADGTHVAATSHDGSVRIWRTADGTLLVNGRMFPGSALGVAFSRDGRTLATGSTDSTILLWDVPLPHTERQEIRPARFESGDAKVQAQPALLIPRRDADGEPLPQGALARIGSLRFQHDDRPAALRYLPDGKTLLSATASINGTVFLWDAAGGKLRRKQVFLDPPGGGWGLAISPNGRFVASSGWSALKVHDLTNENTVAELPKTDWNWHARCFAPDNETLAVLWGEKNKKNAHIRLYDVRSQRETRRSPPMPMDVAKMSAWLLYSPDGKYLAVLDSDNGPLRVWQPAGPRGFSTAPRKPVKFSPVAFSPDGKYLAFIGVPPDRGKPQLVLWDPADSKRVHALGDRGEPSGSLLFSPDGKRLASLVIDGVRWWDLSTRQELPALKISGPLTMVFSPDSRFLAVNGASALRLIASRNGKCVQEWKWEGMDAIDEAPDTKESAAAYLETNSSFWHELRGYGSPLAFSPDSKVLAAIYNQGIRRWEVDSGKEIVVTPNQESATLTAFFPEKDRVAAAYSDHVLIWNISSGKPLHKLESGLKPDDEEPAILSLALSGDGKLAAAGLRDGTICLWSTHNGKELRRLRGHEGAGVISLAFLRDNQTLLSWDEDDCAVRWNTTTGRPTRRWSFTESESDKEKKVIVMPAGLVTQYGSVLSPTGRSAATVAEKDVVRLWSLATGKGRTIRGGGSPLVFSSDGRHLLLSSSLLLDAVAGKELRSFKGRHESWDAWGLNSAAFSPDGRLLTTATGKLALWETSTGTLLARPTGHRGDVQSVAFSADGRTLASAGSDTTILVWDVSSLLAMAAPEKLTSKDLQTLWRRLADADAAKAYDALCRLAAHPETVELIAKQLKPAAADPKYLARLIADLGDEDFKVRTEATEHLESLDGTAEPALRRCLADKPNLETRRRVERLLAKLSEPASRPEQLQALRAVEMLERMRSPQATEVLKTLAQGVPTARLTRAAGAALQRAGVLDRSP
jgi:WD40 repeat protein